MASFGNRSRGAAPPEPYLPDTPDNEREVMAAFGAYRDSLSLLREQQGIPGLMAELTRINAAQQELATRTLSSVLSDPLSQTVARLDVPMSRSRPTASPSPGSERDRGRPPSPTSLRPGLPINRQKGAKGLGPLVAERIVLAQVRAEARRAEREGF